jgi:WD40 repeat protein
MSKVNSAAFSPDGTRVVTASDDKTARVWDATTGKLVAVLRGHTAPIWSATSITVARFICNSIFSRTKLRKPAP